MIKSVTVTNRAGKKTVMELGESDTSGFLILNISGLGAGTMDIRRGDLANLPGSMYNSSRKPERNIVIDVKVIWSTTVEEARHRLEECFPLGEKVRLDFATGERQSYIEGYVEANEPVIFERGSSNGGGIDAQLSIICTDPAFKDIDSASQVTTNVEAAFWFPFPHDEDYNPDYSNPFRYQMPMSYLHRQTKVTITSNNTAPQGCEFQLYLFSDCTDVRIISSRTGGKVHVKCTDDPLQNGDMLYINTNPGERGIYRYRDSVYENFVKYLSNDSSFDDVLMAKGVNQYRVLLDNNADNTAFNLITTYNDQYWGV